MNELLLIAVYLFGVFLYIIIGSYFFEYNEDDYEINYDGTPLPKDEDSQRMDMMMRGFLWPFMLCVFLIFGPVRLLELLSRWISSKRKK